MSPEHASILKAFSFPCCSLPALPSWTWLQPLSFKGCPLLPQQFSWRAVGVSGFSFRFAVCVQASLLACTAVDWHSHPQRYVTKGQKCSFPTSLFLPLHPPAWRMTTLKEHCQLNTSSLIWCNYLEDVLMVLTKSVVSVNTLSESSINIL